MEIRQWRSTFTNQFLRAVPLRWPHVWLGRIWDNEIICLRSQAKCPENFLALNCICCCQTPKLFLFLLFDLSAPPITPSFIIFNFFLANFFHVLSATLFLFIKCGLVAIFTSIPLGYHEHNSTQNNTSQLISPFGHFIIELLTFWYLMNVINNLRFATCSRIHFPFWHATFYFLSNVISILIIVEGKEIFQKIKSTAIASGKSLVAGGRFKLFSPWIISKIFQSLISCLPHPNQSSSYFTRCHLKCKS